MVAVPIHPGIFRITLPLPGKKPGPVNVYLFKGKENITLLDTGTFLTSGRLKAALSKIGLGFKDVDRIVLTHGHVDHYGAARTISRQNQHGIEVYAHAEDIEAIETGAEAPQRAYHRFLVYAGTPALTRLMTTSMFFWFQRFSQGCSVDHPIKNTDQLVLGDYPARIIATPGHTRGSVCVYLENEGILFSGDHILGHITPNALPMLEKDAPLPIRKSQQEYFASLDTIEALAPEIVYPAHGEVIHNFSATHQLYKRCFAQRQNEILTLIRANSEWSIYDMARMLFPQVKSKRFVLDLFLAVSEIYTHIQVLESEGWVRTEVQNRRLRIIGI